MYNSLSPKTFRVLCIPIPFLTLIYRIEYYERALYLTPLQYHTPATILNTYNHTWICICMYVCTSYAHLYL